MDVSDGVGPAEAERTGLTVERVVGSDNTDRHAGNGDQQILLRKAEMPDLEGAVERDTDLGHGDVCSPAHGEAQCVDAVSGRGEVQRPEVGVEHSSDVPAIAIHGGWGEFSGECSVGVLQEDSVGHIVFRVGVVRGAVEFEKSFFDAENALGCGCLAGWRCDLRNWRTGDQVHLERGCGALGHAVGPERDGVLAIRERRSLDGGRDVFAGPGHGGGRGRAGGVQPPVGFNL